MKVVCTRHVQCAVVGIAQRTNEILPVGNAGVPSDSVILELEVALVKTILFIGKSCVLISVNFQIKTRTFQLRILNHSQRTILRASWCCGWTINWYCHERVGWECVWVVSRLAEPTHECA